MKFRDNAVNIDLNHAMCDVHHKQTTQAGLPSVFQAVGKGVISILHQGVMSLDSNGAAEIAHAAETLLQRFGEDSAHQAAIRAVELAHFGDREGADLWRCIERELRNRLAVASDRSNH